MTPSIREIVGEENFARLIAEHGGERIPKNYDCAEETKHRYISEKFLEMKAEGKQQSEILRILAKQFFLSEVRIYQIAQEGKK